MGRPCRLAGFTQETFGTQSAEAATRRRQQQEAVQHGSNTFRMALFFFVDFKDTQAQQSHGERQKKSVVVVFRFFPDFLSVGV